MPSPARLRRSAAVLLATASLAAPRAQEPVPAPLRAQLPALGAQSSWAQDTTYEGEAPDKTTRGVYPVGNGHVFAYCGLGRRANTLQAITGPQYQTDEVFAPLGHFGELTVEVLQHGQPVELPRQRVRRVSGAAFVVTEDAAPGGVALRTLTFAPPNARHLTRVLELANAGGAPLAGLSLRVRPGRAAKADGDRLVLAYESEQRPALAWIALQGAAVADGALQTPALELAAGESWTGAMTITTVAGTAAPAGSAPVPPAADRALADARATLAWWSEKLAGTHGFDTDHRKLRDLVNDWKVLMLVQRCAGSGAVAPMVNYRGAWVRDSNGPMLAFLRYNMWDEARAILRYFHEATRLLGEVPNHVPLDLDFAPLAGVKTDWAKIAVPDAEVPSWVILQHYWYWRVTQDTALIAAHWPLLDVCLKKQKRVGDSLLPFHGDETWLHGALYSVYPDRVGDGSGFVADDRAVGRRAYSFSSGVLFLIALRAMGDMADGVDRWAHPERWVNEPESPPSKAYEDRAIPLQRDLEQRYWIADEGFFAPAVSPVNGEPHRSPLANASLMPLWVGWTYPQGERSRDNLRNSLARLWRSGARIGSTPAVGYTTGHLQGMLLAAICERDGRARLDCLDELLRLAEPAGEWGELYDPDGRPVGAYDPQWPNRLRPWESGVNLEAIWLAITGIHFNCFPDWDVWEIRLKPRLPRGATYVTLKDVVKDGRHLHLYIDERYEKLDEKEREENARKAPDKRRDESVPHRRLHFIAELVAGEPREGYYHLAPNLMNVLHVQRYLSKQVPRFEETVFWSEDTEAFLPTGPKLPLAPHPPSREDGAHTLVLTCRAAGGDLVEGATVVDTGLPLRAGDLAALLVGDDGQLVHETLYLDWGWNDPGRATFKTPAFWSDAAWTAALTRFREAGGRIAEPGFWTAYEVQTEDGWEPCAAPGGRLALPRREGGHVVRVRFDAAQQRELVLRLGSGCGLEVAWNGTRVHARSGARPALPDADARLVQAAQGTNELVVRLHDDGEPVLFARLTAPGGLPVEEL